MAVNVQELPPAGKGKANMEPIHDILRRQSQGSAVDRAMQLARLTDAWPVVAGAAWAEHSHPIRLQNGVLWIGVPDSSWIQRFAFDSRRLQRKICAFLQAEVSVRAQIVQKVEEKPLERIDFEPEVTPDVESALAHVESESLRSVLEGYLGNLAGYQRRKPPRDE